MSAFPSLHEAARIDVVPLQDGSEGWVGCERPHLVLEAGGVLHPLVGLPLVVLRHPEGGGLQIGGVSQELCSIAVVY